MQENRPTRTLADFLVVCVSPVLIMLLVGSLCFFLIEVFCRGEAVSSLRWMMFWFVLAIVLVSRIGIEQGAGHAAVYGLGLAAATWLYLLRLFPQLFIWDMVLLAIVWWCANKLVWDCTLVDENEDASGGGLLQSAADKNYFLPPQDPPGKNPGKKAQKKSAPPHPPGLWVVYFSLAALPLFGIGQMLLPHGDLAARQAGFVFLFTYMTAAFGLLLVTSFLGLRRYLRQRYLQMPAAIAFGWVRFGVCVAAFILMAALLLPRPGAGDAWLTVRHQVDHRLHQASDFAMRFSPHGTGKGRSGNNPSNPQSNPTGNSQPGNQTGSDQSQPGNQTGTGKSQGSGDQHSAQGQKSPSQQPPLSMAPTNPFYNWFKILFFLILGLLVVWWIFRQRGLIFEAVKSIIASIADFFRNLFGFRFSLKPAVAVDQKNQKRRPFAAFKNPFLGGKEQSWTQSQLILYSYDALRAWAAEQGIESHPDQTAREFCAQVGGSFPEIHSQLNRLSSLYSRVAYGMEELENQNLEPLKGLWRYAEYGEKAAG